MFTWRAVCHQGSLEGWEAPREQQDGAHPTIPARTGATGDTRAAKGCVSCDLRSHSQPGLHQKQLPRARFSTGCSLLPWSHHSRDLNLDGVKTHRSLSSVTMPITHIPHIVGRPNSEEPVHLCLKFLQTHMGIWKPSSNTRAQRQSLNLLHDYPANENCLEEQEGFCFLLGMRQHHSLHVVLIFGFHTTTTCPHRERDKPRSLLTSCSCGFWTYTLIHRHLDKTDILFVHFNNSKGRNGQCTAVLNMYCTGLHLHLLLRWGAISPTGLNSFKEVNGIN